MPREGEWRDRGKDYYDREGRHDYDDHDPRWEEEMNIYAHPEKYSDVHRQPDRCVNCGHTFRKGEEKFQDLSQIGGASLCKNCARRRFGDDDDGKDYPTPFPIDRPRGGAGAAARLRVKGRERVFSKRTA